jgi:PAS domain S-box-containing protein
MPSRLPVARERSAWLRYGVTLAFVGVASLLTIVIDPIRDRSPYMLFYAAVATSAVYSGLRPAALATALSAGVVTLLFLEPVGAIDLLDLVNDVGFVAVCGVIIALAERARRGERRERADREWHETTLKSIGDGVVVTDVHGRTLFLNAAAEKLTGWPEREGKGRPLHEIFPIVNQQTRAVVENPVDRVLREGRVVGLANHTLLIRRDGTETPIDDSGAPILSDAGRAVGAVLVFRDISERYEHERQREALLESERAARADAQAANRAKDEFLAVLSHELRTPLNAVLGWTEILRRSATPEAIGRAVDVIERNARRQAKLIEDVLDVSRIVSGRLDLEAIHLNLAQVVAASVDAIRPLADRKDIRLTTHLADAIVLGDGIRLQQVIDNLVSNAVKFTGEGGEVSISLRAETSGCVVAVRDSGAGISADFLPHVFERFRQEDAGSARRYGGLGLGLTIVRHLVELHGGAVSAHSDGPGRGSTFTVRLPLAASGTGAAAARTRREGIAIPLLKGVRIVAVDDEADSLALICEILAEAGAEVQSARSAAEALARLGAARADVLVTDIAMPDHDGFWLLQRARESGHRVPAVAVTAYSSADDRVRALAAGFAAHLPKPLDAHELRLVISRTLEQTSSAS